MSAPNRSDIIVYGDSVLSEIEPLEAQKPYTELERIRLNNCLRCFLFGFNAWCDANTTLNVDFNKLTIDKTIDRVFIESYICDYLRDDLPALFGARVNLAEIFDLFAENHIYLLAMPRSAFTSLGEKSFVFDKNGNEAEFGLMVAFDMDSYDHYLAKGSLSDLMNRRNLKKCGFYTEVWSS